MQEFFSTTDPKEKVIVFVSKKSKVDGISSDLSLTGIACQSIHGDHAQEDREQALEDLRSGEVRKKDTGFLDEESTNQSDPNADFVQDDLNLDHLDQESKEFVAPQVPVQAVPTIGNVNFDKNFVYKKYLLAISFALFFLLKNLEFFFFCLKVDFLSN